VRVVSGTLAELLVGPRSEDYLRAELTDTGALLDPFGRLQERFPNLLEIGRPALALAGTGVAGPGGSEALERDIAELFAEFVAQLRDRPLDAAEARTFAELHAAWQEREREART
jgi:exonuclease SbcD